MSRLRFRSIFISDIHLGTVDCKSAYLMDFLRHTEAQQLYLVGDIIDLEALEKRPYWPVEHGAVLAEFLAIAARGTQVTYIPGNHDAPMRGLCGQKIGAIDVRLNAIHHTADGRRFRVCHGDEFDQSGIGKPWLIHLGEDAYRLLCWINRRFNAWRKYFKLPYLPLSIITKSRIGRALNYIRQYEQLAADAAREAGVDGLICGHIHFGSMREVDGVLYLNDGDWVEHCTALVEHFDGTLELIHWSERRGSLARTSRSEFVPLPAAAMALAGLDLGALIAQQNESNFAAHGSEKAAA
ncbi:UDP-2,3-diacylglucosamine diphosphatase [Pseudolysobacter antarcticus]|uniref:UDP-2,3-diacylglucosamine diphosphatase n=1 Tax=Pseudolysobacter antarcticus TaxID=2511995 RepID=A0A411HFF8_9GAMM|nr:UDP-2,3-diacylglucosamine diphosphatase [Pseudolysobacter antarcticus]QBB69199.1 UDP-2,3-diacylglucosamine diphosphatase [Pseudolysobacter antarcticus]